LKLDSRSAQLGGSCSLIRLKSHAFPFVSSFLPSFIHSFFLFLGGATFPFLQSKSCDFTPKSERKNCCSIKTLLIWDMSFQGFLSFVLDVFLLCARV
jgi:hypothetical protein